MLTGLPVPPLSDTHFHNRLDSMHNDDDRAAFVQQLIAEQPKLLRYATFLLGDSDAASNVVQETNLVIWQKADQFRPGSSFSAWSRKMVYWQTLAYTRDRNRDRHVFSEAMLEQLAAHKEVCRNDEQIFVALRQCLGELSRERLAIVRQRYEKDATIAEIAERFEKTEDGIKSMMLRIRRTLSSCIERKLAGVPESI